MPSLDSVPETPDSKSKRDKRSGVSAKYSDRADDWALALLSELDKFLPSAGAVFLEHSYPSLRESRDTSSYTRAAYQSLVPKKALTSQQKESKKADLRKTVKDVNCTSELQLDKATEKTKDVDGYTRLLGGLEYTDEEKLCGALESLKGSVEQTKTQVGAD